MSKDFLAAFPNLLLPVFGACTEPESPLLTVISEIRYQKKLLMRHLLQLEST